MHSCQRSIWGELSPFSLPPPPPLLLPPPSLPSPLILLLVLPPSPFLSHCSSVLETELSVPCGRLGAPPPSYTQDSLLPHFGMLFSVSIFWALCFKDGILTTVLLSPWLRYRTFSRSVCVYPEPFDYLGGVGLLDYLSFSVRVRAAVVISAFVRGSEHLKCFGLVTDSISYSFATATI